VKKIKDILKRNFLAGLLVLLPISLTVYIILFLLRTMDKILKYLPPKYNPETYLPFRIPGLGFLFVIVIILLTGFLARNYIGNKLIELWENIVNKIPFIRAIYLAIKQLIETIFMKEKDFNKVVLVQYPRKGIFALGFTTSQTKGEPVEKVQKKLINVFMPTTPNPTSGFYLLVPEEELIFLDMSVEEAFKLIISGGIVHPEEKFEKKNK